MRTANAAATAASRGNTGGALNNIAAGMGNMGAVLNNIGAMFNNMGAGMGNIGAMLDNNADGIGRIGAACGAAAAARTIQERYLGEQPARRGTAAAQRRHAHNAAPVPASMTIHDPAHLPSPFPCIAKCAAGEELAP